MKKVLCILVAIIIVIGIVPITGIAVEGLADPLCFTWAWNANKIDADNSVTVVSWSGGSNSSYRSSFIVYDLPEDFTYTSVKTEVIASFAINKATLNNGTGQAPTAAIVMVDGDKVKEAYNLKSGVNATALLKAAKNEGVLLGTYKIGQYPRTSRIKNANINGFFEKHPDVKSIGFYVTNLASDGYSGVVGGIASAMSEFEVNFTAYQNYTNATVKMLDANGNVLDTIKVRDEIGSEINIPETIEKDGTIWVRDNSDSVKLSESVYEVVVNYHDDKADREKYVKLIEDQVSVLAENAVSEKIALPVEYVADDGFVIKIEWISSDESVVANDGTIYQGAEEQTAEIYGRVQIGDYTVVETKRFTIRVSPASKDETDAELIFSMDFELWEDERGSFNAEGLSVDCTLDDEYTITAFIRCDDLSNGGSIFNINGINCVINANGALSVGNFVSERKLNEGQWYHVAVTNAAMYIDGEKAMDCSLTVDNVESYIGEYNGKLDNLNVYKKAFSQSIIKSLMEKGYDSPELEVVSAYVIEGLDSVLVKLSAHGYEGEVTVCAYADKDGVRHTGCKYGEINEGANVISVNVPNMGGEAVQDDVTVLVWSSAEKLEPVTDKFSANKSFNFGFDYAHPDNHMLNNTFTLMGKKTGLYLTSEGLSQRTDNGEWTATFENGVNRDGYYSLKNTNGSVVEGNWTFEHVEKNIYRLINSDTDEVLSAGVEAEWVLNITQYDPVTKVFASEGFMMLTQNERDYLYNVTGQAMWQSVARREKLGELADGDYCFLDGYKQAEKLRELFDYYPSYQINRAVNKSTTGVETAYTLSDIKASGYEDIDGYSKNGYTLTVTYKYDEGDVSVNIYARSKNVVYNIAKGFSYMPYQFIKPLKTVIDYNASNNQFKAETGVVYIETNYEVTSENVAVVGAHELGHLVDFAGYRMSMGDYKTARDNECSVSGYGNTALSEDFAEFCQFVISCSGDKEQLRQLRLMYPGRYDALCKGMCEMYGECILK